MIECQDPKACTILLRGGSKDVLNEMERNLHDAFNIARNIMLSPKLLPGGGAVEMFLSNRLKEKAKEQNDIKQYPYEAVAAALEVIPRTLAHNAGADVVRVMTELRAKHASASNAQWGINGEEGNVEDTAKAGVLDAFIVKQQTIKTAIESAAMLVRIDDIVSGTSSKKQQAPPTKSAKQDDDADPDQKE